MIKVTTEEIVSRLPQESLNSTDLGKAIARLPKLSVAGPWLAGGSIRRTVANQEQESDFDFFFLNAEQVLQFSKDLVAFGAVEKSRNEQNILFIMPSKIEIVDDRKIHHPELKIQLINFRYYNGIEEVLDSFDFTLCQFGFDGTHFYASDFALWDVARKKLVPHTITFATSSLRRLIKYTSQGYTICGGALAQILQQVADNPTIIQSEMLYLD
jgi:hypothetical protein